MLKRYDLWLTRAERLAMILAVAALLLIMTLMTADALARYGLNRPLSFVFELVGSYLMVAAFFLALSHTLREDGHVSIDGMVKLLPARLRHAVAVVVWLLAVVFFVLVFIEGIGLTWENWQSGAAKMGAILWPKWLSAIFVPIGVGLLILRLLHRLLESLLLAVRPAAGGSD